MCTIGCLVNNTFLGTYHVLLCRKTKKSEVQLRIALSQDYTEIQTKTIVMLQGHSLINNHEFLSKIQLQNKLVLKYAYFFDFLKIYSCEIKC